MSLYVAYYQQDFDLGSTLTDELLGHIKTAVSLFGRLTWGWLC